MSLELRNYMVEALAKGSSKTDILETLLSAGWSELLISKTLEEFAGVDAQQIPVPAPTVAGQNLTIELCLYFILIMTLSMSAWELAQLLPTLIVQSGTLLWDDLNHLSNPQLWSAASLLINVPAFAYLDRMILKLVTTCPKKRQSPIRQVAFFIILSISIIAALFNLISILYNTLKSDFSFAFSHHLQVLGITFLIIVYCFSNMLSDDIQLIIPNPLRSRGAKDKLPPLLTWLRSVWPL
jgi:hypothetical protein